MTYLIGRRDQLDRLLANVSQVPESGYRSPPASCRLSNCPTQSKPSSSPLTAIYLIMPQLRLLAMPSPNRAGGSGLFPKPY